MKLTPIVKVQGNKFYQCDWIIDHFPENYQLLDYIEPYAGGASIFLNKAASKVEVLNDVDLGMIQIYRALRDEPGIFVGRLRRVKYCLSTFQRIKRKLEFDDYLDYAVSEFILRRMSVAGSKNTFGGSEKSWNNIINELNRVAIRLKTVYIFQKEARQVINAFNSPESFFYVDPPILEDSDKSTKDHCELADILVNSMGKVMISGRMCTLYKRLYQSWKCVKKPETKEAIWMNY